MSRVTEVASRLSYYNGCIDLCIRVQQSAEIMAQFLDMSHKPENTPQKGT